jgi:hypothetical protein
MSNAEIGSDLELVVELLRYLDESTLRLVMILSLVVATLAAVWLVGRWGHQTKY